MWSKCASLKATNTLKEEETKIAASFSIRHTLAIPFPTLPWYGLWTTTTTTNLVGPIACELLHSSFLGGWMLHCSLKFWVSQISISFLHRLIMLRSLSPYFYYLFISENLN